MPPYHNPVLFRYVKVWPPETLMQLDVSENTTRHAEMTTCVLVVTMSVCSDNFHKTNKVDIHVVIKMKLGNIFFIIHFTLIFIRNYIVIYFLV